MAKISISGNALVITSDMTLEAIKTYRPAALKLMGGENNKETLFVICTADGGEGSINANGAVFTGATHDDAKKACITMNLGSVAGNVKEYVADKYGEAFSRLTQLEAGLGAVLTSVNEQKAATMAAITVI